MDAPLPAPFAGATVRFQAGAYQQSGNDTSGLSGNVTTGTTGGDRHRPRRRRPPHVLRVADRPRAGPGPADVVGERRRLPKLRIGGERPDPAVPGRDRCQTGAGAHPTGIPIAAVLGLLGLLLARVPARPRRVGGSTPSGPQDAEIPGWRLSLPEENDDGNARTVDPAVLSRRT